MKRISAILVVGIAFLFIISFGCKKKTTNTNPPNNQQNTSNPYLHDLGAMKIYRGLYSLTTDGNVILLGMSQSNPSVIKMDTMGNILWNTPLNPNNNYLSPAGLPKRHSIYEFSPGKYTVIGNAGISWEYYQETFSSSGSIISSNVIMFADKFAGIEYRNGKYYVFGWDYNVGHGYAASIICKTYDDNWNLLNSYTIANPISTAFELEISDYTNNQFLAISTDTLNGEWRSGYMLLDDQLGVVDTFTTFHNTGTSADHFTLTGNGTKFIEVKGTEGLLEENAGYISSFSYPSYTNISLLGSFFMNNYEHRIICCHKDDLLTGISRFRMDSNYLLLTKYNMLSKQIIDTGTIVNSYLIYPHYQLYHYDYEPTPITLLPLSQSRYFVVAHKGGSNDSVMCFKLRNHEVEEW